MALLAPLVASLVLAVLTTLAGIHVPGGTTRTSADPFYCVILYDSQGRPINTTCVPDPTGG